jgi:hypothetical protein
MKQMYRYAALVFLWVALPLLGQGFRATLTGHVSDPSGAVVPNASVDATNLGTNEVTHTVTSSQGAYTLSFLKPGTYRLTAMATGFQKIVHDNIVLSVGQAAEVNFALKLGAANESVTVAGEALVLETENADRGLVVDQQQVTELPLSTRNPYMLSELTPGVNYNGALIWTRPFDNGAIQQFSMNGGTNGKNEFLLDGAPNNAQAGGDNIAYVPPVDAVQEFKVQTNSFDAEYGKTSGGVVNVSLKSGSNAFHGTAYEFLRRGAMDANTYQNNYANEAKVGEKQDEYGGSIGGPVIIPKLYNGKDKSFFFVNAERYREDLPMPSWLSVPQPEMLEGDFSNLVDAQGNLIKIYDPYNATINPDGTVTRQAFTDNKIPAGMLNAGMKKLFSYFPKPLASYLGKSNPGNAYGMNDLLYSNVEHNPFLNIAWRFDQKLGSRNQIFVHGATSRWNQKTNANDVVGPGMSGNDPLIRQNDAYMLDWVGTIQPTLVVSSRASWARYVDTTKQTPNMNYDMTQLGYSSDFIAELPHPNTFGSYSFGGGGGPGGGPPPSGGGGPGGGGAPPSGGGGPGGGSTGSYTGLGGQVLGGNSTNTVTYAGSIVKTTGSSTIKAGLDMRWVQYNSSNWGSQPSLGFSGSWTQELYNQSTSNSGNPWADALLGAPSSGSVDNNMDPSYMVPYYAIYAQDDWKISRHLTLNLGLRWDVMMPPTERHSRIVTGFNPLAINPISSQINLSTSGLDTLRGGLVYASSGERPANVDLTGIQPRIGFAYQLGDKLVMRGGAGRYMVNPGNDWMQTEGFSISTSLVSSNDSGRTPIANLIQNPFPDGVLQPTGNSLGLASQLGQGITFFNPNFKLPYVIQFSYGIEAQLNKSKLDLTYAGSRSLRQQSSNGSYDAPSASVRSQCDPLLGGNPNACDLSVSNPFFGLPLFTGTSLGSSPTISWYSLQSPFPQFSSITEGGLNDGKLRYDSLQASYELRGWEGLNLTFGYTWSRSKNGYFYDYLTRSFATTLSSSDRPHVFKVSTIYQLPFGRGKRFLGNVNRLVDGFIGGWEHNMIMQYSSGLPFSLPTNMVYVSDARMKHLNWDSNVIQGVRPCVAKVNDDASIELESYSSNYAGCSLSNYNFLVLNRYAAPLKGGAIGDIRTQAKPTFDMSMDKTVQVLEGLRIQFRAEAFNTLNTYLLSAASFDSSANSSTFGSIVKASQGSTATSAPRTLQIGIKAIF